MWNEFINKEVSLITSIKPEVLFFQYFASTAPISRGKVFQNPNFINILDVIKTEYLTKNHGNSRSGLINSIKQNCPKVIPYYQIEMGKSDITDKQPVEQNELANVIPVEDKESQEPTKLNDTNVITESKSQVKETETLPYMTNDKKAYSRTCRQRVPSTCESEDSFIVFETSDNECFDENEDQESDEDSDDEDEPDGFCKVEENYQADSCNSHINDGDCLEEDSLKENNHIVLTPRNNNKQVNCNNVSKQRFPSICESEDSFIVFERTDDGDDDDSIDEDSDGSDHDTNLTSYNRKHSKTLSLVNEHKYDKPTTNKKPKTEQENKENYCNKNVRKERPSVVSICESEDSFIMFERTENEDDDSDNDSCLDESSDQVDSCNLKECESQRRKVRFAPEQQLCKVYPMIKWSYAYQAARKGPWEMHARDRTRFNDRINRTEEELKSIFNSEHRDNVYKQRFEKHM